MPQEKDRRDQVLHWDDVHVQSVAAVEGAPIEEVDRELAAMGYDLDKVRDAADRLGRGRSVHAADDIAAASRDTRGAERLPLVPTLDRRAVACVRGATERHRAKLWNGRWAAAGAAGAVLAVLLALPISAMVVTGWFEPQAKHAKVDRAGAAKVLSHAGPRDEADERYAAKIALLKKCAAAGHCGDGRHPSAGKKPPLPEPKASDDKRVVAMATGPGLPDTDQKSSAERSSVPHGPTAARG